MVTIPACRPSFDHVARPHRRAHPGERHVRPRHQGARGPTSAPIASRRATCRSMPTPTCWWSVAVRRERPPRPLRHGSGAKVVLLERYNHLGGLSTGGLVIWIDRMTDWSGELVIRGFAEELFDRLPRDAVAGPRSRSIGVRPTREGRALEPAHRRLPRHRDVVADPRSGAAEAAEPGDLHRKRRAAGYHSWASEPILRDGRVAGVTFESKEGRLAIHARVVVDASGDGDVFARAGAAFDNDIEEADIHHCMNTAWLFGGVDMKRWIAFRAGEPEACAAFMARGRAGLRPVRAAVRLVARRHRPVHGPAADRLLGARRRRPDRGGGALAPRDGGPPGVLPCPRAGLRERVHDAAARRRSACAIRAGCAASTRCCGGAGRKGKRWRTRSASRRR